MDITVQSHSIHSKINHIISSLHTSILSRHIIIIPIDTARGIIITNIIIIDMYAYCRCSNIILINIKISYIITVQSHSTHSKINNTHPTRTCHQQCCKFNSLSYQLRHDSYGHRAITFYQHRLQQYHNRACLSNTHH